MRIFHGTDNKQEILRHGFKESHPLGGYHGIWFTTDREKAKEHGKDVISMIVKKENLAKWSEYEKFLKKYTDKKGRFTKPVREIVFDFIKKNKTKIGFLDSKEGIGVLFYPFLIPRTPISSF